MVSLAVSLIILILVAAWVAMLLWRLRLGDKPVTIDAEWLNDFSTAKYRPMMQLLSTDDYELLATQEGRDADDARRLRKERRRVFCAYLTSLAGDFERLHAAGKLLVTYGGSDRTDLMLQLFQRRVRFYLALGAVYLRLALHIAGLSTVDVATILDVVDSLRADIAALAPAAART